jgi:hypothetical protein
MHFKNLKSDLLKNKKVITKFKKDKIIFEKSTKKK